VMAALVAKVRSPPKTRTQTGSKIQAFLESSRDDSSVALY
jgi:hypothetical protein